MTPLRIEEIEPGRRWRLIDDMTLVVDGETFVVPAGTETDGASIPALLRPALAVWGTYGRAAALHDWLCQRLRKVPVPHARARREADWIFRRAALACGTSRWLAWSMWAALRLHHRITGRV